MDPRGPRRRLPPRAHHRDGRTHRPRPPRRGRHRAGIPAGDGTLPSHLDDRGTRQPPKRLPGGGVTCSRRRASADRGSCAPSSSCPSSCPRSSAASPCSTRGGGRPISGRRSPRRASASPTRPRPSCSRRSSSPCRSWSCPSRPRSPPAGGGGSSRRPNSVRRRPECSRRSPSRCFGAASSPVPCSASPGRSGSSGATLTFAGSLSGVTRTMPPQIYLVRESDPQSAIALSLLLVAAALIIIVLAYRSPHAPRRAGARPPGRTPPRPRAPVLAPRPGGPARRR